MGSSKPVSRPIVTLYKSTQGPTVGYVKWGKGGVVALASSWAISNEGIKSGDNLIVMLNALDHQDPTHRMAVTFDEYHHGYGAQKGILSLLDIPARLGLAQLGMAFLLLLFATSRRFGRPIPLREGGRQRSEYLSSMSTLLKKAQSTDLVRRELGRRFMQDAALALGLPPTAEPAAIVDAANRRRPDKAGQIRQLIIEATPLPGTEIEESALLSLVGRWHDMRKELTRAK